MRLNVKNKVKIGKPEPQGCFW